MSQQIVRKRKSRLAVIPEPTWLVECRMREPLTVHSFGPWTLTAVPQKTGICDHCGQSIFGYSASAEHRA